MRCRMLVMPPLAVLLLCGIVAAGNVKVIVGFKGSPDLKVLRDAGGVPHRTLAGVDAVAVDLPASAIAKLRKKAEVAYVEEDGIASIEKKPSSPGSGKHGGSGSTTQPAQVIPWGIDRVAAPLTGNVGAGVKVAVIDTGIDFSHPDLKANIKGSVDFTGSRKGALDENGHGTHVSGTIAAVNNTIGVVGVAPGASLYAVRVLDRRGYGYWSDVAAGILWCSDHGMNVANMSLGGSTSVTALQDACDTAEAGGVLLIAAAGNSGDGNTSTTETSYPAAYSSVVAVGATDDNDALASFSNSGSYVEVSGPGVSVYSTYKGSTYATLSGTSMASPHATGLAALIWDELSSPTAASVRAELDSRVRDEGPTGRDNGYGYGIVYYPK